MTDNLEGQMSFFAHDTSCGKMLREATVPTTGLTFKKSSLKSSALQNRMLPLCLCLKKESGINQDAYTMTWEDGQLLGDYTTQSFGEHPKEENESHLSQILVDSPQQKYYLSEKACIGILRRSANRGKPLPDILKKALEEQINDNK